MDSVSNDAKLDLLLQKIDELTSANKRLEEKVITLSCLSERLEKSAIKMDRHINFVERIIEKIKYPLLESFNTFLIPYNSIFAIK